MAYYIDTDLSDLLFAADSFIERDYIQCNIVANQVNMGVDKARMFLYKKYGREGLDYDIYLREFHITSTQLHYVFEYFKKNSYDSLGTFEIRYNRLSRWHHCRRE